jgi:hypothetical protein
MTGLVRKATLFAVCGLLAANAAMASTPSAANSICPGNINWIGYKPGGPGPNAVKGNGTLGGGYIIDGVNAPFTITVNDLNNLPVNNSFVVIDFSLCDGLQLCSDQDQAGIVAVCDNQVRGFTGPGGTLTLSIGGHANNTGSGNPSGDSSPYSGLNGAGCASISADGVPLAANIQVATFDQNGGGVFPSDQSCYLGDYFRVNNGDDGQSPDRSDYDASGTLLPSDQAIYLAVYFSLESLDNCGAPGTVPECPGPN